MIKIKRVHVPNVCVQVGKSLVKGDAYVTIAYDSEKIGKHPLLPVGLSFCSPRDQLNKKLGVTIAIGKLGKRQEFIHCNQDDTFVIKQGVIDCLRKILNSYEDYSSFCQFHEKENHLPRWLPSLLESYEKYCVKNN